jgi:hypothetical protein
VVPSARRYRITAIAVQLHGSLSGLSRRSHHLGR